MLPPGVCSWLQEILHPPTHCNGKHLQSTVQAGLLQAGGYLLEGEDSLALTAFTRPAKAIRWALDSIDACLHADW